MPPPQAVNRSSVNPRDNANIVSILTFGWMQSLFESGKRKKMDIGDLFPQLTNTHAKCLTTSLNSEWHKEVHNSIRSRSVNVPRLWIVLARMIPVRSYLIMFCLCVCTSIASVAQPLTLGLFLRMLADPSRSVQSSVFYTLALSGVSAVKFLTMHHSECMAELWSMKLCAATTGLIYKKVRFGMIMGPGAPLTNFNDGGSDRGSYFIPPKITTWEFVYPNKSLLSF